jgi:hypothetical protein
MGLTTASIAALVLLVVAVQTVIAWRAQPGAEAGEEFLRIWRSGPWAKQFYLDFWGLEVVLALWMVSHAVAHGGWWLVVACIATMPILGAMSAALYWIVAVAL